ncbi:ATP-binding protein [Vulcanisaeta sp. JCM 16161]|uniref:ATP-binding protein n=1 Tax=Vulcanisaeta sp. JCM 16161 TaxID=1295372 RepID=UPI001FB475B9|nr:ATP-binding protein [Vulcanisaeta sp. JCM 16161]
MVTVLDWHGEYAGLLPTLPTSAINIDLEKIPPKLLTEILASAWGLMSQVCTCYIG